MIHIKNDDQFIEIKKKTELIFIVVGLLLFSTSFFLSFFTIFRFLGIPLLLMLPGYLFIQTSHLENFKINAILSVCLSILYCIFVGLLADGIGLLLKVDKPLSASNLLLMMLLSYLGIITWWFVKFKERSLRLKIIRLNMISKLLILISAIILLLSLAGSSILNNGGSSGPTFLSYVLIGLMALLVSLNKQFFNPKVYPFVLWIIGIALLMSSGLRSHYLSGVDINAEYQLSHYIQMQGYWSINLYKNAYNACLSISLLPVVLSNLTKINLEMIHKAVLPLSFSVILLPVYEIAYTYLRSYRLAFFAGLFFAVQPAFFTTLLLPIRQEVALLFFSGAVLLMILPSRTLPARRILFILMNLGMILSHYSTAYMAIAFYALVYVPSKLVNVKKINSKLLSGNMLVLLLVLTFLWYSQLTTGFKTVVSFTAQSVRSIPTLLSEDSQASGQTPAQQLNPFSSSTNETQYTNYIKSKKSIDTSLPKQSEVTNYTKPRVAKPVLDKFEFLREFLKDFGKLAIVVGGLILILRVYRSKEVDYLDIVVLAAIILLGLVVVLPFVSINYDFNRAYQQLLIIIAPAFVVSFSQFKRLTKHFKSIIAIFLMFYLLFLARAYASPLGGSDNAIMFSNGGSDYDSYYTHTTDVLSGSWLSKNNKSGNQIFADTYGDVKLKISMNSSPNNNLGGDIFNALTVRQSYVFSDFTNSLYGVTIVSYHQDQLIFEMPTQFLSNKDNLVYNNSGAKIYQSN